MKKSVIFLIIAIVFITTSSCQSYRRGVQFHSGDKNTSVIDDQMSLTEEKKTEYQIELRRLKRERGNLINSSKDENLSEIKRLENAKKRLEHQLKDLQNNPQKFEGDRLLSEIEDLESKISQKEERLQSLYESSNYPSEAKVLDERISEVEDLLFDLQLAEDKMIVRMNSQDELDYFQGDIRNGQEAANAYMLMKWVSSDGNKINDSSQSNFEGIIINEYHQSVTAVIKHSNGYKILLRLEPKSEEVIKLPFPGEYISYFEGNFGRSNYVSHNVTPTGKVLANDREYDFLLIKHRY